MRAVSSIRLGLIYLPAPLGQPAESGDCANWNSPAADANLSELFSRLASSAAGYGAASLAALPGGEWLPGFADAVLQVQIDRLAEELEAEATSMLAAIEAAG